ncbi:MAG: alpha/beta hydrolase [Pararhodobacter sp.]|nr:alpha/beta hydrolase [Pararhodobacter sp.]
MNSLPDLSRDYANADFIPGAIALPARWRGEAAALRDALDGRAQCGIAYGPGARQTLDLFMPESAARGLMVFIHGGYWLDFAPGDWSGFAAGALARGWAVAMPGYTLAPEARIAAMTQEVATAISKASALVPDGPLVVTGHSAGGHLSARMACNDLSAPWAARLRRVMPISPLADLRPLMQTGMNERLQLDLPEAEAESPALRQPRAELPVTVWVGAQERPAFLWQARLLSEAWDCPWHAAPGHHHFSVINPLCQADSDLTEALLGGL